MYRSPALVALVLLLAGPALAERPPPQVSNYTGRPGQSEPSVTVPRGLILLNSGLTIGRYGGEGLLTPERSTWTAPDLVFRAGVLDVLELRVSGSLALTRDRSPEFFDIQTLQAVGPSPGIAVALLPETEWIPAVAVIGTLILPAATLDPLDLAGELKVSASKGIGAFGVTANLSGGWDNARGESFSNYTLAGTWALPADLSMFIEAYGGMDVAPHPTAPSFGIDGGLGVKVSPSLAFDVSAGAVLVGEPALFLSVGGSWLFR